MSRTALIIGAGAALLLWLTLRRPAAAVPSTTQGDTIMDAHPLYSPAKLTAAQEQWAEAIIAAFRPALGDDGAAFGVALAVTESSLRPTVTGDDGQSIGLFQLTEARAHDFDRAITADQLLDGNVNVRLALRAAQDLIRRYPGHTWGDYAEAWTLGAHGRFGLGRRNPSKVAAMQRAIADLALTLDLTGGPYA